MSSHYERTFELSWGGGPVIAAAVHAGHYVRPQVAQYFALDDAERLREEDPFTDFLTAVAPTRIIGRRSRFEFDLNRPREQAVYQQPTDCWGLNVWKHPLPSRVIEHSLAEYDRFYESVAEMLRPTIRRYGHAVVLDLHSYNHRREGANGPCDDEQDCPEINIGTGTMDRSRWAPIVDGLIADLQSYEFLGRRLDVRENVKFRGGYFSRWLHETFPDSVCAIAIEFKKTFMDEWTGIVDVKKLRALAGALRSTVPGINTRLQSLADTSVTSAWYADTVICS